MSLCNGASTASQNQMKTPLLCVCLFGKVETRIRHVYVSYCAEGVSIVAVYLDVSVNGCPLFRMSSSLRLFLFWTASGLRNSFAMHPVANESHRDHF